MYKTFFIATDGRQYQWQCSKRERFRYNVSARVWISKRNSAARLLAKLITCSAWQKRKFLK